MLFAEQLTPDDTARGFVPLAVLAQRFEARPDPMLASMGGCRVDVAIGIDRTVYQLELALNPATGQVAVSWVRADTVSRKLKDGKPVALGDAVPVTLEAAVTSMCETFGLKPQDVWNKGVDLLAFWEANEVSDQLELPMSRSWNRHSLKSQQPAAAQAA